MNSCIEEDLNSTFQEQDGANVELKISLASINGSLYSRDRSNTMHPDGQESGTSYECTIPGVENIKILIFDDKGTYKGNATDLAMVGDKNATIRIVSGKLPKDLLLGTSIKMVFMANYENRGEQEAIAPSAGYQAWSNSLTFNYGTTRWSETDANANKYIPMSGECNFIVRHDNYQTIDLKRVIAKVRVLMAKNCTNYNFTSLKAVNANSLSYCLEHDNPIGTYSHGLTDVLTFYDLNITSKNKGKLEFYFPEQTNQAERPTTLQIGLTNVASGSPEILKDNIDFKYYPNGNLYPIERNHIYEFIINKKADETKADIQVTIMPWASHDINTDYE